MTEFKWGDKHPGIPDRAGRKHESDRRVADAFVVVLHTADALYERDADGMDEALALFDREMANIRHWHEWALRRFNEDREDAFLAKMCLNYALLGAHLGDMRFQPRARLSWMEVALEATRRLGNRRSESELLNNIGLVYYDLGDVEQAIGYFERSLDLSKEIGDRHGEGQTLGNLGNAWITLGDPRRAIEYYEQDLAIAHETADRRGEAMSLGNLGAAWASLNDARRAIDYYEQDLAIAREVGDRRGEAMVLGNLGVAWNTLGDVRKAVEIHRENLVIARELGDDLGEGCALFNLALALDMLGDRGLAISHAEAALDVLDRLESPHAHTVRNVLNRWRKAI
jgi:tetratricopeptide (TPR) repeat protein